VESNDYNKSLAAVIPEQFPLQ